MFLAVAGNISVASMPSMKAVKVNGHKMLILCSSLSDYTVASAEKHLAGLQRSTGLPGVAATTLWTAWFMSNVFILDFCFFATRFF